MSVIAERINRCKDVAFNLRTLSVKQQLTEVSKLERRPLNSPRLLQNLAAVGHEEQAVDATGCP